MIRLALLATVLAAAFGCGKQAKPQEMEVRRPRTAVRRMLPPALESAADTQRIAVRADNAAAGQGLIYKNDRIRDVPWSINLLKVDRTRRNFELITTLGQGRTLGLNTLSQQLESLPAELGVPVAAVNGDFYRTEHERYEGDPRGLQITRGELVSAPNGKTAFWIDADGKPSIGNVAPQFQVTWPDGSSTPFGLNEERHSNDAILYTSRAGPSTGASGGRELVLVRSGDSPWLPLRAGQTYQAEVRAVQEGGNARLSGEIMVLSIGPTFLARVPRVKAGAILQLSTATSPDLNGAQVAVGGGPVLLHGGKVQSTYTNKARERHPRTAFGWNDDYYFFFQVDGRQYGFSIGMTLPEVASYLAKQGCEEAMNLDGGGSSEMWVQGRIVNRPCFGYERNTANGLAVVRTQEMAAHSE